MGSKADKLCERTWSDSENYTVLLNQLKPGRMLESAFADQKISISGAEEVLQKRGSYRLSSDS